MTALDLVDAELTRGFNKEGVNVATDREAVLIDVANRKRVTSWHQYQIQSIRIVSKLSSIYLGT